VLRFFALPAHQATVQPVQVCCAHGAAESSEQPIIVLSRIIDSIFVDDPGIGQGTDLNEAIPVATGAGEAGGFSTPDRSRPAQADFGDERLTTVTSRARRA
jgi:hypothetical protein